MKNKGFTLVELLAVITLMALLSLAAFELLDSVNKGNREKAEEIQIKNILASAIAYVTSSKVNLPNVEIENSKCRYSTTNSDDYFGATYTADSDYKNLVEPMYSSDKHICYTKLSLAYLIANGILEENIVSPNADEVYDPTGSDVYIYYVKDKESAENFLKGSYINFQMRYDSSRSKYDGSYLYYFDYKTNKKS